MNGQMHSLIIYKSKDNGEHISTAHWKFIVEPNIELVEVEDVFRDGKVVAYKPKPHEIKDATTAIKEFLFKQRPTPLSHSSRLWAIEPPLNDAEWFSVKRQLMVNEL